MEDQTVSCCECVTASVNHDVVGLVVVAEGGIYWKQPHRYKPTSLSENHKQWLLQYKRHVGGLLKCKQPGSGGGPTGPLQLFNYISIVCMCSFPFFFLLAAVLLGIITAGKRASRGR